MRFLLDENLGRSGLQVFRVSSHDAIAAADLGLSGRPDDAIMAACRSEDRILVTLDQDFLDLRIYPLDSHPGIIVLRLGEQNPSSIQQTLQSIVHALSDGLLVTGRLWVVDGRKIRIRESSRQT